jgi:hypothetical protein
MWKDTIQSTGVCTEKERRSKCVSYLLELGYTPLLPLNIKTPKLLLGTGGSCL